MINLFQISSNDQSIFFLSQIFGGMAGVIPAQDAQGNIGISLTLIGTMFKTFNSIVLAVGALIVVYVTVVGVMATAQEGEFLGKKWHSLWVPLRIVLGISALVPTPSGYSGIQIIMMWIIVQGIGAADMIWNTVLNYVNVAGSPYAQMTIPTIGIENNMQQLFQGLVCEATTRAASNAFNPAVRTTRGSVAESYYCRTKADPFCQVPSFDLNRAVLIPASTAGDLNYQYSMGPSGSCGNLVFSSGANSLACQQKADGIGCLASRAQVDALRQIVPTLGLIAQQFFERDLDYLQFFFGRSQIENYRRPGWLSSYCASHGNCAGDIPAPYKATGGDGDYSNAPDELVNQVYTPYFKDVLGNADFIKVNVAAYTASIMNAISDKITQMQTSMDANTKFPDLQQARDNGWLFAGAYYHTIAKMNDNNFQNAMPTFVATIASPAGQDSVLTGFRYNITAAKTLASAAKGAQTSQLASAPAMQELGASMYSSVGGLMSSFMNTVSGGGPGKITTNPLAQIQSLGRGILITIEILFFVIIIGTFILSILGNISVHILGTGVSNPVGPAMNTIFLIMSPIILGFMGLFAAFGGMLAVYTPLIPYIIFTVGALGWFIAVIETMVAAPLVALGVLSPGGHHEILGKAEPALMLLFGVFLRPGLMIFGMMFGMILSTVAVSMINAGFLRVMKAISEVPSLLELIFFMGAYVFLIITVLNKCFSLIHVIPERALTWIGGHAQAYGEAEALGEVKGGVQAAGAGAQQVGGGAGSGIGKFHKGQAKASAKAGLKGGKSAGGGAESSEE